MGVDLCVRRAVPDWAEVVPLLLSRSSRQPGTAATEPLPEGACEGAWPLWPHAFGEGMGLCRVHLAFPAAASV